MKYIKLLLGQKSVDEKVTQGTSIKTAMTGNPNFQTPNPSLTAVGTVVTNLQTKQVARANAVEAAKAATVDLHAAEDAYDLTITQLAAYAEGVTLGDPVKLESGGFELRNPRTPATGPDRVENLQVITNRFSGRFLANWNTRAQQCMRCRPPPIRSRSRAGSRCSRRRPAR